LIADNSGKLGSSNNNYFFNPYQNSHIYAQGAKTLAQWQAYSGMDGNSKTNWFTLTPGDPANSVIFYNDTKVAATINLGHKKYLDLDQNQVIGSLNLAPFTSKVLIDSGEVALAPAVLYFDDAASPAQNIILKNITGSPLTINSITASAGFAQTHNCPPILPIDATCTISVTFTSLQPGPIVGSLTVTHNAGDPYTASLFGGLLKTYLPLIRK
jgi:hypothetical protein